MPEPVEASRPYLAGLDGIRAIAVLGVIAFHVGAAWAPGGLLGVGVFFVLSGYLITDLLVAEYRRRHTIDLGQGLITPGRDFDDIWAVCRASMDKIDFRGKRVLDIGACDGLWSFGLGLCFKLRDEFVERRHGS